MTKTVSAAQAKFLARNWGNGHKPAVGTKWTDATVKACVARGWLRPTNETGKFPDGSPFTRHEVTPEGLDAIASFLTASRSKEGT